MLLRHRRQESARRKRTFRACRVMLHSVLVFPPSAIINNLCLFSSAIIALTIATAFITLVSTSTYNKKLQDQNYCVSVCVCAGHRNILWL